jgi:hypothetical protein
LPFLICRTATSPNRIRKRECKVPTLWLHDSTFVPSGAEQPSAGPELGVTVCGLTLSPFFYLDYIFLFVAAAM